MTKNSQKITAAKKMFFYQNLYLPIPRPPGNGINTIRIRDKHPGPQHLICCYFVGHHFALLDLDPDSEYTSVADPDLHPNPDP
jgi:hypothetical protein